MKIEIFPANIGDSFLISYGENLTKHILIDGGYKETYSNFLKKRLCEIAECEQTLELIIVTHIDQDHISGILKLIEENGDLSNRNIIEIKEIWHNSYKHLCEDYIKEIAENSSEEKIIEDIIATGTSLFLNEEGNISGYHGSMLASYIYEYKYNWNTKFNGNAILADNLPEIIIDDELKIIVLSPMYENLKKLKNEWERHLRSRKIDFKFGKGNKVNNAFEFFFLKKEFEIEEEVACSYADIIEVDKFKFPKEDTSKTNASSIAIILESKNNKFLFLGDSIPSIILKNLKKLKEEKNYLLDFDVIKIAHHGSLKNMSNELLEIIEGKNWIFTGNGSANKPSKFLVEYILEKKKDKFKKLIFNYQLDWLDTIKEKEKEYNCKIIENNQENSISLLLESEKDDFR